jgi:hypothetical protein
MVGKDQTGMLLSEPVSKVALDTTQGYPAKNDSGEDR